MERRFSQFPQQTFNNNNTTGVQGWLAEKERNKPQSNAVGSAVFIFVSGGMSIAWSTGFNDFTNVRYSVYLNVCWFVAAIIGAAVGAFLTNRVRKKIIMLTTSAIILLGAILFLALHSNFAALMVARHLNGFAVGLAFVTALVMSGEIVVKHMRGLVASSVDAMGFALGAFFQIIFSANWTDDVNRNFDANQMHGLMLLIFATISLAFAHFLIIESPVYLLLLGQEEDAIDTLRRLQDPAEITYQTYQQLEEHKCYIAESKAKTMSQSFSDAAPALVKMCIFRCITSLSFSLIVNFALRTTSFYVLHNLTTWPYVIYGASRWIGSIIGMFLVDSVGRKKPLLISAFLCGSFALGIGIIYGDKYNLLRSTQMIISLVFLMCHQFFAGIAVASSSAYLSEAFPLAAKPYCIAIVFAVELLVQIIIGTVNIIFDSISDYFYILGAFSLLFIVFSIFCLPETRHSALYDAQIIFRGFANTGF